MQLIYIMLNIEWEKYLYEFIYTTNYILNIKPNDGETTWWFLINYCFNPNSLVFAIDEWKTNEQLFDDNISNILKSQKQLIKIKNNISVVLTDLITNNKYKFNIIYLNVSYDALTVYNDIILLWELLDNDGIIIFDECDFINTNNNLNPKLAIEYFINQYKLQIDILNKDTHIIIKKNLNNEIKLGLLDSYTNLITDINSYRLPNIYFTIKQKIKQKLSYKLSLSDEPHNFLEELGYNNYLKKLIDKFNVLNIDKYNLLGLHVLLRQFTTYTKMNNILYNKSNHSFNPYQNVIEIYKLLHYNSEGPIFEYICNVIDNNLLTLKEEINVLNCTFSPQPKNKMVESLIKKIYPNINIFNYYDLNISSDNLHSKYRTKLYNASDINNIIKKFDTKMHLMIMVLTSKNLLQNNPRHLYEKYYTQQLFYSIIFILQLLRKNGTCIILSFGFFTEINIELLYILKKYFKKLIFTKYGSTSMITTTILVIASRFKGIPKEDLDKLLKITEEISIHNNKYDDYDNNYKFINKILDIDKTNKEYRLFKAEIVRLNLQYIKQYQNNLDLFYKIVKFHKTNTDNIIMENIIIRKQIQILFYWLNRYNLLKIFNNKSLNN